ncbi:MAG: hemolysin family protein [Angelakisella sp.]
MDPDTGSLILSLIPLLLGGLVVFCQNAIVDIPDNFLKHADPATPHLQTVEKLLKSPRRFDSAMRVGYTFFHLCFAFLFTRLLGTLPGFSQLRLGNFALRTLWMSLTVLAITLLLLIFSRGIPRRLATFLPTATALAVAPLAWGIALLFAPLRAVVDLTVGAVVRLFGAEFKESEDSVTEEEIRMLVDVSEETGGIEQTEKEMINNIFEFDDLTVGEIMTHRTDLSFIETDTPLDEVVSLCVEHGFSRIPVVGDSIDEIAGILNIKDLLPIITDSRLRRSFKVSKYLRKPLFVPESTRCSDLFGKLNEGKTQLAVVVDEYGGTSGIVTMEDLLESIVGKIQDEYDHEVTEATELSPDSYTFDGDIDLDEVGELMDCDLEEYEDDYETLGGLVIGLLDRIPAPNEHPSVTVDGVEFLVAEANERQILRITARKL